MSEFSHDLAVVVGIDRYTNGIAPLKTAVNDVKAIAHLLQQDHHYQVLSFIDQQATLASLKHLLTVTLPQQVKPDSRLLLYFAGHGIAFDRDNGPEGYLIPQDARTGDISSYLSVQVLQEAIIQLRCRHFLGILDCCFAGAFRWSRTRDIGYVPEVIHKERYDRFIQDPAWQLITSSAYDQRALDSLSIESRRGRVGNHSPFADALIKALSGQADLYPAIGKGASAGDGVITATELYLYLREQVEPITEASAQRQTPGLWPLTKHDKGEYIFLTPGHTLNLPPAPALDKSKNPYRGFNAFEPADSDLFFGRDTLSQQLFQMVSQQPLTVVLGASGCGKSSLIKAGLIAALMSLESGEDTDSESFDGWQVLPILRLGDRPLLALQQLLSQTGRQYDTLVDYLSDLPSSDCKVALAIDQFEELFTLCDRESERAAFLEMLNQAIAAHPHQLRLILTLRADFEPQLQDSALKPYWNNARFMVTPMMRADLRAVIVQPAAMRVIQFQSSDSTEPSLVDKLIDEVVDMPGGLPLLSSKLSELYLNYLERQEQAKHHGQLIERTITEPDYRELGSVAYSLTQRADKKCETLVALDARYALTIRSVMLRLVAVGGGQIARRRVPIEEFDYPDAENQRVQTVIQQFIAARLLVKGRDADGKTYIEPAHDALVMDWQKLLAWQQAETINLSVQRQLTLSAQEWQQSASGRFLWHNSPYLNRFQQALGAGDRRLNQLETTFIRESLLLRRREASRRWRMAIAMILGLSGLSIALLFGRRADLVGQIKTARNAAEVNLQAGQSLDALQDSLVAAQIFEQPLLWVFRPDDELRSQVKGTLQTTVYSTPELNRLLAHQGIVRSDASPNGQFIVSAGEDDKVVVWNWQGQQQSQWVTEHPTSSILISPDSQTVATGSANGSVRLWTLDGDLIADLRGHSDAVRGISFSPNGELLATAGRDNTIRLWDLQQQRTIDILTRQTASFWHQEESFQHVVFSPNGQQLASNSEDGTFRLWNLQGEQLLAANAQQGRLHVIRYSPDGGQLATAGEDGRIRLWSLSGKLLTTLEGHQGEIWDLDFDSQGRIASASGDGTVRLWSPEGQLLEILQSHQGPVRTVRFAPDDRQLVTSGDDSTIRLWNFQRQPAAALDRLERSLRSTSPDGQQVVTADEDGVVRLRNLEGELLGRFEGHLGIVNSVAFSPNGEQIASGGQDGTVRLWNVRESRADAVFQVQGAAVNSVSFHPGGTLLASGDSAGNVQLWDIEAKAPFAMWQAHSGDAVDEVKLNDGELITQAEGGDRTAWPLESFEQLQVTGCQLIEDFLNQPDIGRGGDRNICR